MEWVLSANDSFRPEPLLQSYPAALPNSQTATIQQKLEELKILTGKFSFPEDAHKILEGPTLVVELTTCELKTKKVQVLLLGISLSCRCVNMDGILLQF
jgi:hypothetical protein